MSAESGKGQPIYTSDSFRLAVDAMCEEWDEWAVENQGTRECFEASLRKALSRLEPNPDPVRAALAEALKAMLKEDDGGMAAEQAKAALRAAGEVVS